VNKEKRSDLVMAQIVRKASKRVIAKPALIISALFLFLFAQACSDIHTLAWNKAEETIDGHKVVIKPCRNSYTGTETYNNAKPSHIFGCGDKVKVKIRDEALVVNDKSYGTLGAGDSIEVKDGKVFINAKEAVEVAKK
jgi:hypothetical protein